MPSIKFVAPQQGIGSVCCVLEEDTRLHCHKLHELCAHPYAQQTSYYHNTEQTGTEVHCAILLTSSLVAAR